MTTIALFGAAGKIGARIAHLLHADPAYTTLFIEAGAAGQARLEEMRLVVTPAAQAVAQADVVILAVPDLLIGKIPGKSCHNSGRVP